MDFAELTDWMRHRPANPDTVLYLPDGDVPASGYFNLRLGAMTLTDERRWAKEIVPTAFVLTEFNYGREKVRRPFFVSNALLSGMPDGVDQHRLRVTFRDTAVLGPTPYAGGDVALFVGLFQMAVDDRLKSAFAILERLFGEVMPGPAGDYLKLAGQLANEISSCLTGPGLTPLLAQRGVIGKQALPAPGWVVYVKADGKGSGEGTYAVIDGELVRTVAGVAKKVTDRDHCLVRIEHQALRNDYASMPFHAVFEDARKQLVFGKRDEARMLLLECTSMIYGSLELTEADKANLIAFYQARLLAIQSLRGGPGGPAPSPVPSMQARALQHSALDGEMLADSLAPVDALYRQFAAAAPGADVPVGSDEVQRFMQSATATADPKTLVRALSAATLVQ